MGVSSSMVGANRRSGTVVLGFWEGVGCIVWYGDGRAMWAYLFVGRERGGRMVVRFGFGGGMKGIMVDDDVDRQGRIRSG